MFTIKYRTYNLSSNQPPADCLAPTHFYDECEMVEGPFAQVSKEMVDGYVVVYAHRDFTTPGVTYGPVKSQAEDQPRPTLWVMNDQGATVAKYDL